MILKGNSFFKFKDEIKRNSSILSIICGKKKVRRRKIFT